MSLILGSGSSALRKLNLAALPFENRRPKRRLATALWVLAGLVTAWNLFLFVEYWRGSSSGRDDLRAVRAEIDERATTIRELESALSAADLSAQNEHVRFLNRKIAERTFPWSRLFDDLAEVLPRNVRLESLVPSIPDSKKRRGEEVSESIEWINLRLRGVSKTSDDILELVDAMFTAEVFAGPVLSDERDAENEVEFDLAVRYRVNSPDASSEPLRMTDAVEAELPGPSAAPASSGVNRGTPSQEVTSVTPVSGDTETRAAAAQADGEAPAPTRTPTPSPSVEPRRPVDPRPTQPDPIRAEPSQPEVTERQPTQREPARAEPSQTGVPGGVVAPAVFGRTTPGSASSTPAQAPTPEPGQDPRRGQRRVVTADDVPQRTRDLADERFGRDQDVAPRVDNASRGGG